MSENQNLIQKYIQLSLTQRPFYDNEKLKLTSLTNHLYMVLVALSRMNATEDQIEIYFKSFTETNNIQNLKSNFDPDFITPQNFEEHIGNYEKFEEFLSFFQKENKTKSPKQLLAEYVPKLSKGIGAEAFHNIIQLGYAIDWGMVDEEIVQALAYFSVQNVVIKPKEEQVETRDGFETFNELKQNKAYFKDCVTFDFPTNIVYKQNAIAKNEKFIKITPQKVVQYEKLLDDLQLLVLKVYVETQNFTILHAISGITCMRQTLPYVKESDREEVINDFVRHLFAGYACGLFLHKSEEETAKILEIPQNLPQWQDILNAGNASVDDHDIKFVYICWIEARHYGEDSEIGKYCRYAASIRMKLVPQEEEKK